MTSSKSKLPVQLWLAEQKYVLLFVSDDKSLKSFMEQIPNSFIIHILHC